MKAGLAITIAAVMCMLAAAANAGLLDGQTFEGTVTEKGKEPGKDTLIFKDDTLLSTGCVEYGFNAHPYSAEKRADGSIGFESEMKNSKGEKIHWEGTVKEGILSGKMSYTQTDGKVFDYSVNAEKK